MASTAGAPGTPKRYFHSLWLLSARDLKVRYSTSALGYLWSVLDPLVMSAIYWFVFTQVFQRTVGEQPYIIFLITALLPWVWFNSAVGDFTRAFKKDARLVRSTSIPRTIWVNRIVLSKGTEFLFSLPVLAIFVIVNVVVEADPAKAAHIGWGVLWFPVAVVLQAVLLVGLGLLVAPLCALYTDLERTTALVLRALFYATPIIYSVNDLPRPFDTLGMFNPLAGIFSLYRMAFFPDQWHPQLVLISAAMSFAILALGFWVFRTLERPILKEL
ncbi:ABC transporter permease [Microbacterium sp. USHLN186]|uniref:ABC transporter permease n=1 Tax=Microbacterium sp. USHLN186 TaxID=3081286 RepID=UPI00301AD1BC